MVHKFLQFTYRMGSTPGESEDVRLQKSLLVTGSLMFIPVGFVWGAIYLIFGEPLGALVPICYSCISLLSFIIYDITHRYAFFLFSQLLLLLLAPFGLLLVLGGFINSSGVILWSLFSPLGALLFTEPRQAPRWFLAYVALVILGGLLQPYMRASNNLPSWLNTVFFVMNIGSVSAIAFTLLISFVGQKNTALGLLRAEQAKSEALLLNILPKEVAAILKNENRTIADHFEAASILFADVVNFTPLSATLTPAEVVGLLNEVFSHFDTLVEKYGLEKIKTIGDCYMVAAGVPKPRPDHAEVLACLALEMQAYAQDREFLKGRRLTFRIGLNSGPVVAGVIGRRKFIYDLWGDAVNTASRMESNGSGGRILVTETTYELIKDMFILEFRGTIPVKGKGEMPTWYLEGIRPGFVLGAASA
ncbi:MAG: adenylate/guanylate cyclase domain-containing protein [Chloroflexi bacterium]|nr:adenylate/guanylate cyclase domain-containing protein [Chloroflexota bacterium]